MKQYRDLLEHILQNGEKELEERTGAGTLKVNGYSIEFDLAEYFPAATIRPIAWKGVLGETLTFLHGETNNRDFLKRKCSFWTPDAMRHNYSALIASGKFSEKEINEAKLKAFAAKSIMIEDRPFSQKAADANEQLDLAFSLMKRYDDLCIHDAEFAENCGKLGPVYGAVWRGLYPGGRVDQIKAVETDLKNGGKSRRNIVTGYNPDLLHLQALPPCHYDHQILTRPASGKLDLIMNQRSADSVLGVIHNIPQYALIANLYAQTHNYGLGKLRINFGDLHIYLPHIPVVEELLERTEPNPKAKLEITTKKNSITEYEPSDIKLIGYEKEDRCEALPYRIPMFGGLF
jgi:thymidylate synthase